MIISSIFVVLYFVLEAFVLVLKLTETAGIHISDNSAVVSDKNSNAKFINNSVDHGGAAIFLTQHSNVIFEETAIVTFIGNKAISGIIYSEASSVLFEQSSIVMFTGNKATNGTIHIVASSNITFKGICKVTFTGNSATRYGAAIYAFDNSHVTFTGNSKVTFINNIESSEVINNGTIYSESNGYILFEENSSTVFTNNTTDFGAAIFSSSNSLHLKTVRG